MQLARRFVAACLPLWLGGCGLLDPNGGDDQCERARIKQELVEEIVTKLLDDALWVALMSHDGERAYSLTLVGVEQGARGIAFLADACDGPAEFEPFCDAATQPPEEPVEPFWQTRDRCGRLACEAVGVGIAEVYFTMIPHTEPDDRHPFSYPTDDPEGNATYDPNPFIRWWVDQTNPQAQVIDANVDFALTLTPQSGDAIHLRHNGTITVAVTAEGVAAVELQLSFPDIRDDGRVLSVELTLVVDGGFVGGLSSNGETSGTITGSVDDGIEFAWSDDCEL